MIDAGLPLIQCLDILSKQTENKAFAKTIVEIKKEVEGRHHLCRCLAQISEDF